MGRLGHYHEEDRSKFRIFAPQRREIAVVLEGGRKIKMSKDELGYWNGSCEALPHGTLYKIEVNGKAYPDPASRYQPDGVHGHSMVTKTWASGRVLTGKRNWGYDGTYQFALQESYGTYKDLKDFIEKAHSLGIAVILDVVYNHFGPEGNYTRVFADYTKDAPTPWGAAINFDSSYNYGIREFYLENIMG